MSLAITYLGVLYLLVGIGRLLGSGYVDEFNMEWVDTLHDHRISNWVLLAMFAYLLLMILLVWVLWPYAMYRWRNDRAETEAKRKWRHE